MQCTIGNGCNWWGRSSECRKGGGSTETVRETDIEANRRHAEIDREIGRQIEMSGDRLLLASGGVLLNKLNFYLPNKARITRIAPRNRLWDQ